MEKVNAVQLMTYSGLLINFILVTNVPRGCSSEETSRESRLLSKFDQLFKNFLERNLYKSGFIGVMEDGKLVYTKGINVDEDVQFGSPLALWPSSSFSKLLTSAAILKLAEDTELKITDSVFCDGGILQTIGPWNRSHALDSRVCDISVDHLLRHTAGWDSHNALVSDTYLYQLDVSLGHDDQHVFNVTGSDDPNRIIRYMLTQKLDHTPGIKSSYSNFGYSVLGRVIEQISGISYAKFIKRTILEPCGLWHTRLGPRHTHNLGNNTFSELGQSWHSAGFDRNVDLLLVDSTLGWHSNVFDILRFMRCIDGSGIFQLLNSESLQDLTKRPEAAPVQHKENWLGAGVRVSNRGSIWLKGDSHADDMFIYHSGPLGNAAHSYHQRKHPKFSWVYLLEGSQHLNLKLETSKLIGLVKEWPRQDLFMADLSDFKFNSEGNFPLVKAKLSEHHLDAFVNSVKFQGYKIIWLSAYSSESDTYFSLVATRSGNENDSDFFVESGLTETMVRSLETRLEGSGYQISFLQSYMSHSHGSMYRYVCVLEQSSPYQPLHNVVLRVDRSKSKTLYHNFVQKGFIPKIQSIRYEDGYRLDYIFENSSENNFKSYVGIDFDDLETTVCINALSNRELAYLDVARVKDKPTFSAIFRRGHLTFPWVLLPNLGEEHLHKAVLDMRMKGLSPRIIVGYPSADDQSLHYIAYFGKL